MAFVLSGGAVVSYAEAVDVRDKDQRVFEANEINFTDVPDNPGSLNNYIEDIAIKSTGRINQRIRASAQWRQYVGYANVGNTGLADIPEFNPSLIIARRSDFTDMCCYYALKEYLLPKVADFGNPESPEVQKIEYYSRKFEDLFQELMDMFTWYDANADGNIATDEKLVTFSLPRRTRGRRNIVKVR